MITEILSKVLPVLVMIALGRRCETRQIINDEQHAGLKAIVGDILLPVVLFQAFFTADYGKRMLLVFVLVFVGYGAALAAGIVLSPLFRGTGYAPEQRTQGDFGSDVYLIEETDGE